MKIFLRYAWLIAVAVIGAAVVFGSHHCEGTTALPPEQATLLTEFAGAYPVDAPSPRGARSYTIVAEPSATEVIEGRRLQVWSYNGQVPGPTLRVRVGEQVRVALVNRLPQDTTIHWHGVRVPNEMDGTPGVTQRAVRPGESFVYEFVPRDAGTFWFHPHVRSSEQVERGLFGVLVVEDDRRLPFSRDVVWVLDDWRLGTDGEVDPQFNTLHDLAHDGRWGNVVTVNGHRLETLTVRPGERIRLRLINTANGRVFSPDFSRLRAKVIAVDGMYAARAIDPQGLEIAPGNRFDVDLTVDADQRGRRFPILDRFTRQPFVLAEIRVDGDAVSPPVFDAPPPVRVPTWRSAAAVPVSAGWALDARRGGAFGIEWLLRRGDRHRADHDDQASLHLGRFAKLRFTNAAYRLHPMHIHGMFFKVLSRNGRVVDEPFWRDTVLVHPKETVEIGTVPVDGGRWMMHCHVLEHAEAGMMTTLDVRPP